MDDLVFRRAEPADADALADVFVEGMATYRSFAGPDFEPGDPIEVALGYAMRLRDPDFWCLLAALPGSGLVVGDTSFMPATKHQVRVDDPTLAQLTNLFVRERMWGTGLAARLHAASVMEAGERGFTQMRLFTPVLQERARRFYEREGWSVAGEPFFEAKFGLDLIEYRRSLG